MKRDTSYRKLPTRDPHFTGDKTIRTFKGGATRNAEEGKLDFEGFLSPLVIRRYAEYLHAHRTMEDGSFRDSDNWQRGMPLAVYMKSLWRHFWLAWALHRGHRVMGSLEDALCAVIFNASGYLHEIVKRRLEILDRGTVPK